MKNRPPMKNNVVQIDPGDNAAMALRDLDAVNLRPEFFPCI